MLKRMFTRCAEVIASFLKMRTSSRSPGYPEAKGSSDFGVPLPLATKEQIARELARREDEPCLIAYRMRDGAYAVSHNIDTDNPIPVILRDLADIYEDGEVTIRDFEE